MAAQIASILKKITMIELVAIVKSEYDRHF